MFEKCNPEHLGVDINIKGSLLLGSSPTEQFFGEHGDGWLVKKLLPPPSPTFFRPPLGKRDVYVVANGEYSFPEGHGFSKWAVVLANNEEPLKWKKPKNKDVVILLMPGMYDQESLNMKRCPYTRIEMIGAARNNMYVLLTGGPGGYPLDEMEEMLAVSGVSKNSRREQGTKISIRVNNLTIRQDSGENAVFVSGSNYLELDTISVLSRWTDAIKGTTDSHILLRNTTVTSPESGIVAAGGLIILNSLFEACGSLRDEIQEDNLYREYPTIFIQHHTHFFMWNSEVRNSVGHAIGKRPKTKFDPNVQEKYALLMQLMSARLGGDIPVNLGAQEVLGALESDAKRLAGMPEGFRKLEGVSFKNNQACTKLCGFDEFRYCPDMNDEVKWMQKKGVKRVEEWVATFKHRGTLELVEEQLAAMSKWKLMEVVDPNFSAREGWKKYMEERSWTEKDNVKEEEEEEEEEGDECDEDLFPSLLRRKVKSSVREVMENFASPAIQDHFVNSLVVVKTDIDWEDGGCYRTFSCTCRLYSLCANGGYIDLCYQSHLRPRYSYCEDFDQLFVEFVGQPGGPNLLGTEDGVLLISREAKYSDDSDCEYGQEQLPDEEQLGETVLFDALQGVVFGRKVMCLPKFVELLWASVGGMDYSRSQTGVNFAVKLAVEQEKEGQQS